MGTSPTIKLIQGGRSLDLSSGRYRVSQDFNPPAVQLTTVVAAGTSASAIGTASVIDRRAKPRTWSFSIDVYGNTEAEVRRGLNDLAAFLSWAGDDQDPVYLSYKPNSDTPEPSWGQDGTLRYEIVDGTVDIGKGYGVQRLRERYVSRNPVTLTIQPYATGLPQTPAQAKGAITHDTVGTGTGRDRGVVVGYPTTNVMTNPIHGHPTWNTGWTASANMVATENSDPRYIPEGFGVRSAKLQAKGASADWYQSPTLTVSTYTLSCYVKRPDGGVVDSSVVQLIHNSSPRTTTYKSVGDGWYRLTYAGTGAAAVASYGLRLAGIATILYASGWKLENVGYATPVTHGDMAGCAWSSTAHASTTTVTTPFLRLPISDDFFNKGAGCIRAVVTIPDSSYGSNLVVFYDGASGFRGYFDTGGSIWFNDGTNSINGSAAITAGVTYVVHWVWDQSRLQIYVNGSSVASGGTHTVQAGYNYLYIGSDNTPALHQNQVFGDFTVWNQPLTTAQVLADYTNIAPIVADGQRVNTIPYLWTKDGDNAVDSFDDSSYDNWCVVRHVPGSAPAGVRYEIENGVTATWSTAWLGLWATREFINPGRVLYSEQSGTADGTCSGAAYKRTLIGTSETAANTSAISWASDPKLYRFVGGREWFANARMRIASGTGKARQLLFLSGLDSIRAQSYAQLFSGYFRDIMLPSVVFPDLDYNRVSFAGMAHYVAATNSANINTDLDFYCLFPKPMIELTIGTKTTIDGLNWYTEFYDPITLALYNKSGSAGSELALEPDAHNVLLFDAYGRYSSVIADNAVDTITFSKVAITPRYSLV